MGKIFKSFCSAEPIPSVQNGSVTKCNNIIVRCVLCLKNDRNLHPKNTNKPVLQKNKKKLAGLFFDLIIELKSFSKWIRAKRLFLSIICRVVRKIDGYPARIYTFFFSFHNLLTYRKSIQVFTKKKKNIS